MSIDRFKAMLVNEESDGKFSRIITEREFSKLPNHDIFIQVKYSSLNYKDALSATGNKGITKEYPHTPGIDASGIIAQSNHPNFKEGDEVIAMGFDLGMNTWGAFGEYISVPSDWVCPLPKGLSLKDAMLFGTAGFTAAQSIDKLEQNGLNPTLGEILVTGSTGGVGSMAVAMLYHKGYDVVALTGKLTEKEFLFSLGAKDILDRKEFEDKRNRPLMKPRWAGVIDTVGGNILTTAVKSTLPNGSITCCGMITSVDFHSSIFPFILRGVNLLGVDSAEYPAERRKKLWEKIAGPLNFSDKNQLLIDSTLEDLNSYIDKMLNGQIRGRVVVTI